MHLKVTTYKENAKEKIRRHKKRLEVGLLYYEFEKI